MDLRISSTGDNVSAELAKMVESRMRSEKHGGNGCALLQVDLSADQLKQARRDLWRCLMEHHPELDLEGDGHASETDGIGKVDCLPDSCLSLQVLPCFRKLFAHMLGADPDQLVSTMDVPQYVPPGRGQPYMGLTVGSTGVVGLLCLTSQQVTSGGECSLPGTLVLYNTKQPEHHGRDRVILPNNPTNGRHPWLGLRIGFWPRHSDKFRSPCSMRKHLFLRGSFGLQFRQSPGADTSEIRRRRAQFLAENALSRFYVPPVEESPDEAPGCDVTERQLFFDRSSRTLKFVASRKPKEVSEGKPSDVSPGEGEVPDRGQCVERCSWLRAAEMEESDGSWAEGAQYVSAQDRKATCCSQIDLRDTPPPLRDSTRGTSHRYLEGDVVGADLSDAPRRLLSPRGSEEQPAAKRARREICTEGEPPETGEREEQYPLTDLVYDSMYEDSEDECKPILSRAPVPRREDCSEALNSLAFDAGLDLLKAWSQDKVAVCTRKQGPIYLSPQVKLSALVFCNLQGLDGVGRTWNSREMEASRTFVVFCSLPDQVYEVRGAKDAYDLVRVAVCGLARGTPSKAARSSSLYTLSDFHKEGKSLAGAACTRNRLYQVLRVPKSAPGEGYPAFFDLRQHMRKGRASLREWGDLTMKQAALRKIEWDSKAQKLLGEPARGIGGHLFRKLQQEVKGKKQKQEHELLQLLESLCRKEHRAARGRHIPVHLRMLSLDEVLDTHGSAVRDVLNICADLTTCRAAEKEEARKQLGRIVRKQMQLIDLMKKDEHMRLAYGAFKLSSGDLFLHVIMARLEAFKQLVKEVRQEYCP